MTVQTDLTTEELHDRYRSATNPVERTHWHILWLMKEGHAPDEIASMLGYTARWVRTIVRCWKKAGEQGIRDQRLTLPGAPCLLSAEQQKELDQVLDQPPADGGLWSGPKVAVWMAERLGRPVDPRRGWDYLQRLGRSTRVPRPQHERSDQAAQQAFKKTSRRGREAASGVSRGEN
ncbi:winged helix-turn-helix domain-containing protein [Ktedonobacter sp. SOSP1-52]|uniref:winged helix-turn-helix domain-containing protein n=1 Tax=Ktedonobacter sp. SOSP1-52 TaxID=2778366 RepID=UPI001F1BF2FE|nr:winged helix-turn-helix domain-containing protein [Ktedonobacter sp. SOSP1-52]